MAMHDIERVNPNPRLVWFMNYAIDEVTTRLDKKGEYSEWLGWASSWKAGKRSPQACVDISHFCFDHPDHKGWGLDGKATNPIWHTLGQLAWGAKEACYDTPKSGWLVVRYIADAMVAFGVAFPDEGLPMLEPPLPPLSADDVYRRAMASMFEPRETPTPAPAQSRE